MSAWNTRDWEPEDKSWELTEEDTDDEFDDVALARLGVDLPACAREDVIRPIPQEGVGTDMTELMNRWREVIANTSNSMPPEIAESIAEIIGRDGNIHFGDEPQGIDPAIAGFEDADESCEDCGMLLYECECHTDDYNEEEYCDACGLHFSEDCECEY